MDRAVRSADPRNERDLHPAYHRAVLGHVKLHKIGPDSLDALYAHLRRCSRLCGRLQNVEHYARDAPV